ncbi:MAG: prephenate dehydrogenase [Erysipelotrichaceae bacterium]|nr:prephenate dehydrogenase [Erysipelotrichaceae bacterium]
MVITVVGLGVVGGSYVQALKGLGYDVYGVDLDEETLRQAKEDGCIIEGYQDAHDIVKKSDMTIICLYPSQVLDFIATHEFKSGSLVTDVVGIKSYFLEKALKLISDDVEYVSGHPMAGKESRGYTYASKDVFIDANYIIIEHEKNTKEAIEFMCQFVSKLGFKTARIMSPYDHDEIISFTSQLSHVIAVSLIDSDTQKFDTKKYTGDSYRDLTRIANINEELWCELFLNNKKFLLQSINNFEKQFDKLKGAIINDDSDTMIEMFKEAAKRREALEQKDE